MKFTKEQYDELIKDGGFYIDDAPFDTDKEDMFRVFNALPQVDQGEVVKWGFQDTEVRDIIFTYIIRNQFDMDTDTYYESDIATDYFNNDVVLSINYEKLENENA